MLLTGIRSGFIAGYVTIDLFHAYVLDIYVLNIECIPQVSAFDVATMYRLIFNTDLGNEYCSGRLRNAFEVIRNFTFDPILFVCCFFVPRIQIIFTPVITI